MEFNKKNVKAIIILITFTMLLWILGTHLQAVFNVFKYIYKICRPIITGLCIAFVLNVLLYPIENVWFKFIKNNKRPFVRKLTRPVGIVVTLLVIIAVLSLFILFIIPGISETVANLIVNIPTYISKAYAWFEQTLESFNLAADFLPNVKIDWDKFFDTINNYLSDGGSTDIINTATTITSSVFGGIVNALLSFVLAIYILAQKEKISKFAKSFMQAFLREKTAKRVTEICTIASKRFSNFIRYQCLEALILGTLCFILMLIFKFPYALLISVIVAVTALVPVVGPVVGTALGTLIIFTVSPIRGILFLVMLLVLQQIETAFIYPRVVGHSVGLPGVIVLSAVLIGGNIGGVLGSLISTPVAAVMYVLTRELIDKRIETKKARMLQKAKETEKVQPQNKV